MDICRFALPASRPLLVAELVSCFGKLSLPHSDPMLSFEGGHLAQARPCHLFHLPGWRHWSQDSLPILSAKTFSVHLSGYTGELQAWIFWGLPDNESLAEEEVNPRRWS